MRLKNSIFLWVSLATILPLTALILGITAYSERVYRKNIDNDVSLNMQNIAKELEFRLLYEREVLLSLASSPAMKQFEPILQTAAAGDLHINYFEEVEKLNNFLAGFQHSVPGIDTVRVLDADGHTLIKVRFGKRIPADFESIADLPLAEEELIDQHFLSWMSQLNANELVYANLPSSQRDYAGNQELSVMNAIVPVSFQDNKIIGYITARALGDQFDHILNSFPRANNMKLNVVEYNPDTPRRHGMLLYSDELNIKFDQTINPNIKLNTHFNTGAWEKIQQQRLSSFVHTSNTQRIYLREFFPYNNRLVSWIIVIHLENEEIAAPFQRIRLGLLAFAGLALFISLILANLGARKIAEPITHFAGILKRYADGESKFPAHTSSGADELKQLDQSFHYLVDTLETTEKERDKAQEMMLQNAKLASIGEMAAGIGHEINNPLNNILSYATLIERDLPTNNKALLDDIQGLRNEAKRASKIVKGILNFARQVPPSYVQFDLHSWLQDTQLLVQAQAHEFNIELNFAAVDFTIYGDRGQLQQVLVNLLMNAIQASPQNSHINISTHKKESHILIQVSDQGCGLDDDIKNKIFDPFFSTKTVGEGSGLGLSISIGIMQYHNGNLTLQNNAHGGVDAIMQLPTIKPDNEIKS